MFTAMDDRRFDEVVGLIGSWFFLAATVACFIIALFFNGGYWFFVPFLALITLVMFDSRGITFIQREDEV